MPVHCANRLPFTLPALERAAAQAPLYIDGAPNLVKGGCLPGDKAEKEHWFMSDILMPPEWASQEWLWIGFPHLADEWPGWLEPAQRQIADFASAVAESGQQVRLLVRDKASEATARRLASAKVRASP